MRTDWLLFGVNLGEIPESKRNLPHCQREGYNAKDIWVEMLDSQVGRYGLRAMHEVEAEPEGLKGDGVYEATKVYVGVLVNIQFDNISNTRKVLDVGRLISSLQNPSEVSDKLRLAGIEVEPSKLELYVL